MHIIVTHFLKTATSKLKQLVKIAMCCIHNKMLLQNKDILPIYLYYESMLADPGNSGMPIHHWPVFIIFQNRNVEKDQDPYSSLMINVLILYHISIQSFQ